MTVKKDTAHVIGRRKSLYQVNLVGKGFLVGIVSGLVVLAYRIALTYAGDWLNMILNYCSGNPLRIAGWFGILILLAFIVGKLLDWEPMISGSGIPQMEGEMTGKLDQTWWKVLPAKFLGGFLSLLAGLSLGREGPSIQLGSMTGKGVSRALKCDKSEEKILLTCGASAGLAAAFHAPLAGIMFSLEEVHKNFSSSVLVSAMASSLAADYISSHILGLQPVFQFQMGSFIKQDDYWIIVLLGVLLGFAGAFYNWFTLFVQSLFKKATFLNRTGKLLIPFLCAGVLGFVYPVVLGSGHAIVENAADSEWILSSLLLILAVKFLFSAISFGSGAPGGIFFPLLVLGSLIGASYGTIGVQYLGWDPGYIDNVVCLSMAGFFSAIVRAPLTGILLIFEMTGSLKSMLSLSLVSIVAYVVANLLHSAPIYESLLERLLEGRETPTETMRGDRVLQEFVIMHDSVLENKKISEIGWPKHCLIVAVQRGTTELLPKGSTKMEASDMLVIMTDEKNQAYVNDLMNKLCSESK